MKHILCFVLFFSFYFQQTKALERCLIFDIDKTLFVPLFQNFTSGRGRIIRSLNIDYFMLPGAPELILSLLKNHPQYKIKFFSAGGSERNQDLIYQFLNVFLSDEEIKNYIESGHFYIFSYDHLRNIKDLPNQEDFQPQSDDQRFFGEYKKDLSITGCDLNDSILIDDSYFVIMRGQEKNFIPVVGCSESIVYDYLNHKAQKWETLNYIANFYQIFFLYGFISELLEQNRPLNEILTQKLYIPETGGYHYGDHLYDFNYFEKGRQLLTPLSSKIPKIKSKMTVPVPPQTNKVFTLQELSVLTTDGPNEEKK